MLLQPENAVIITPTIPQNIQINWQMAGGVQQSFTQLVTFKLHLYEVTTPNEDVRNSVENSKAVKIFESQPTTLSTISLDFSTTLLGIGNQYVYRIQAIGPMNWTLTEFSVLWKWFKSPVNCS